MPAAVVGGLVFFGCCKQEPHTLLPIRCRERDVLQKTCLELRKVRFLAPLEAKLAIEGLRLLGRTGARKHKHRAVAQREVVRVRRHALPCQIIGAEELAIPLRGLDQGQPFASAVARLRRH